MDLQNHARSDEDRAVAIVEKEIERYGSLKISFDKEINFRREKKDRAPDGEVLYDKMKHYFKGGVHLVTKATTRAEIKEMYRGTMDIIQGEIDNWDKNGSGWEMESVKSSYVNISQYNAFSGSSFIPLPPILANKKAIINVKNNDEQCLKWALKSALFPVAKDSQRTSKYLENDGLNWEGIEFLTKVTQIRKLEKQNQGLAINVWGWENDDLTILWISDKSKASRSKANKPYAVDGC